MPQRIIYGTGRRRVRRQCIGWRYSERHSFERRCFAAPSVQIMRARKYREQKLFGALLLPLQTADNVQLEPAPHWLPVQRANGVQLAPATPTVETENGRFVDLCTLVFGWTSSNDRSGTAGRSASVDEADRPYRCMQ